MPMTWCLTPTEACTATVLGQRSVESHCLTPVCVAYVAGPFKMGCLMALPFDLVDRERRAATLQGVYELSDCMVAIGQALLVFNGPMDDRVDIDSVLHSLRLDVLE